MAVMIVSNFIIVTIAISSSKKGMETQMKKTISESVHATADAVEAFNEKEFKMLETLAALPDIKNPAISAQDKAKIIYGTMSLDKDYVDVCILDKDGYSWINGGVTRISFAERDYYQMPYKTGKRYFTDPFINKVTNTMAIFYSVPVFDENKNIINVIFSVIDGFKPSDLASSHKAGNERPASMLSLDTGLTVASENHDLVAAENLFDAAKESGNESLKQAYSAIQTGVTAISKYNMDKQNYLCAYEKVNNANWMVVNTVPEADFQEEINAMTKKIIGSAALFTILAFVAVGLAISLSINSLNKVKKAIQEIATGNADLTKRIEIRKDDEIGDVVKNFNLFEEKLQGIIKDIKNSKNELAETGNRMNGYVANASISINEVYNYIEEMKTQIVTQGNSVDLTASSVTEVSSNIASLEKMIQTQAEGVMKASAAVEEMIGNIASVNKSVEQMAQSFEVLLKNAEGGVLKQNLVVQKIGEIESQSAALQGANEVISKIASQTNLLAMNAAIEAAHAGDAGKGFSVVADEIKKLSENSARESSKISEQLNGITISVSEVVQASSASTNAFKEVSVLIEKTNDIVRTIKDALEEQNSGSKEINEALHTMNDNTSEVRSASHEMSVGNKTILDEIKTLKELTDLMKLSMDKMTGGADKINVVGKELGAISPELNATIENISSQIDQFQV